MKHWQPDETQYLINHYEKTPNHVLADHLGRTYQAISLKGYRMGLKKTIMIRSHERRTIRYSLNQRVFANLSPDVAYVVGFVLADGTIGSNRMKISNTNFSILEQIRFILGSSHPIAQEQNRLGKWHTLTIVSMNLRDDLIALGISQNKSLNAELPKIPDNFFSHFLRGYFDGDGGVYHSKRGGLRIKFTSGSEKLLKEISHHINKLYAINGSDVVCDSGRQHAFRLWYYGKNAVAIMNIMYKDSGNLYIEKKRAVFNEYHNCL